MLDKQWRILEEGLCKSLNVKFTFHKVKLWVPYPIHAVRAVAPGLCNHKNTKPVKCFPGLFSIYAVICNCYRSAPSSPRRRRSGSCPCPCNEMRSINTQLLSYHT